MLICSRRPCRGVRKGSAQSGAPVGRAMCRPGEHHSRACPAKPLQSWNALHTALGPPQVWTWPGSYRGRCIRARAPGPADLPRKSARGPVPGAGRACWQSAACRSPCRAQRGRRVHQGGPRPRRWRLGRAACSARCMGLPGMPAAEALPAAGGLGMRAGRGAALQPGGRPAAPAERRCRCRRRGEPPASSASLPSALVPGAPAYERRAPRQSPGPGPDPLLHAMPAAHAMPAVHAMPAALGLATERRAGAAPGAAQARGLGAQPRAAPGRWLPGTTRPWRCWLLGTELAAAATAAAPPEVHAAGAAARSQQDHQAAACRAMGPAARCGTAEYAEKGLPSPTVTVGWHLHASSRGTPRGSLQLAAWALVAARGPGRRCPGPSPGPAGRATLPPLPLGRLPAPGQSRPGRRAPGERAAGRGRRWCRHRARPGLGLGRRRRQPEGSQGRRAAGPAWSAMPPGAGGCAGPACGGSSSCGSNQGAEVGLGPAARFQTKWVARHTPCAPGPCFKASSKRQGQRLACLRRSRPALQSGGTGGTTCEREQGAAGGKVMVSRRCRCILVPPTCAACHRPAPSSSWRAADRCDTSCGKGASGRFSAPL